MSLKDFYSDEEDADLELEKRAPEPIIETADDIVRRIAAKEGRRYIGWPCDNAQDLPIGKVRSAHVQCCPDCARIKKELIEPLLLH